MELIVYSRGVHQGHGKGPKINENHSIPLELAGASLNAGKSQRYEVDFDIFHISFTVCKNSSESSGQDEKVWVSIDSISTSMQDQNLKMQETFNYAISSVGAEVLDLSLH